MVVTDLTLTQEYVNYIRSKDLSVIHFYAQWAAQCKHVNDVLEEMTNLEEFKNVRFAKIIAEDVPEISLKAGVSAVPTVLLIRDGNIIDRVDGVNPAMLTEKIKRHLSDAGTIPGELIKPNEEELESKLKKLINQAPCMLFMKGNRENPRCGFSKTIVSILDGYKAEYQTFDILQDNSVREGLKKYSNWPTYPQLYVNGELIGGLDIVKEMSSSGELESMLPQKVAS